ncbi:MAG: hypothetical protein ABI325_04635 [Ginsengibacter sp.]
MTTEQINKLVTEGVSPGEGGQRELIETHISWVILGDEFVYKIKKPIQYSFLDFSSIELRKLNCDRELELNKRLAPDVYIAVVPIREYQQNITIGGNEGTIIDYAVKMHKLKVDRRMDKLLVKNEVSTVDIKKLAERIASFHKEAAIINEKNLLDIREEFNDLKTEKEYLAKQLDDTFGQIIDNAIRFSDQFLIENKKLIGDRLNNDFYRDCHGDLHSRNIFLLPEPVPFDCIEFNDDFRQIDVLNEVAFLCMDLDAFDRKDLSELFLKYYNQFFPAMETAEERKLFIFYKSYRANIRAKVNSLRARSATTNDEKSKALSAAEKYLTLMKGYITELQTA